MKFLLTLLSFVSATPAASAAMFVTNTPEADAFVRSNAPTSNYGAAGALSVSGPNAVNSSGVTNGVFDGFIRFNTAAMMTNFNAAFGSNNWVISSATLVLTENTAPGNAIFNQGTGAFAIRWVANTNWVEGTGTPMAATTTGITYSEEASLLNTNTDTSLGAFTFTGAIPVVSCPLAMSAALVTNLQAGGEVDLFLTAIDPGIGFVFYSRNFAGKPSSLPSLVVSAVSQPGLSAIAVAGTNIVLTVTNGVAGGTYYVLTSTNLGSPFSQWTPVATNVLTTGGPFGITLTNAVNANNPPPRFFILQTY